MAVGSSLGFWYGRPLSNVDSSGQRLVGFQGTTHSSLKALASCIQDWTPLLLVVSYFVFSTAMYTFCTQTVISMFWFFYLSANFYIAGSTVLEAFMSLTPCRNARRVMRQFSINKWDFPTPDSELLLLDLVIVSLSRCLLFSYCSDR